APHPIAHLRDLLSQVVVEPTQHRELGDISIGDSERAQSMRQAASGLSDDVGVACIRLGFTRVQIRDTSHRKARQVRDEDTCIARNGHWKGTDAGGLVNDEQNLSVLFKPVDQRPKLGLIVRQAAIKQAFSRTVQSDGVMADLPDINADEDVDIVMLFDLDHASSRESRWSATYGS